MVHIIIDTVAILSKKAENRDRMLGYITGGDYQQRTRAIGNPGIWRLKVSFRLASK